MILEFIKDPDKCPRKVEKAMHHVNLSLGQRRTAFIDPEVPLGLTDVVEHYFS